jgi:DNA repair exonuclease SbcCD ATPase subunit
MRLKVEGFRCYQKEKEWIFPDNGLILLQGKTGSGKSTVLNAIYWCLYKQVKNVYSWKSKNKKCRVELQIGDWICIREKNPERITVISNGITLTGEPAEMAISNKYGSKDLWLATSYLIQDSHSVLLCGSSAEKTALLEKLTFVDETPESFIQKVNTSRKEAQTEFEFIKREYDSMYSRLESRFEEAEDYDEEVFNNDNWNEAKNSILETEREISSVEQVLANLDETRVKQLSIQSSLEELEKQKADITIPNPDEIEKTKKLLEEQRLYEIWKEKREKTAQEFDTVMGDGPFIPTSDEDFFTVKTRWEQIQKNKKVCARLNLNYSQSDIESAKEEYENILQAFPHVQRIKQLQLKAGPPPKNRTLYSQEDVDEAVIQNQQYNQGLQSCQRIGLSYTQEAITEFIEYTESIIAAQPFIKLQKELNTILSQGPLTTLEEMKKSEKVLEQLEQGLEVHDCPQCKTHLRFHSGKLVLSKVAPESRETVIQAKEEVQKSKEGYQRWLKHKTLTEQLEGVEGLKEVETLSPEKEKKLNMHLSMAKKILVVSKGQDYEMMRTHNQQIEIHNELDSLKEWQECVGLDIFNLPKEHYQTNLALVSSVSFVKEPIMSVEEASKMFKLTKLKKEIDELDKVRRTSVSPMTSEELQEQYLSLRQQAQKAKELEEKITKLKKEVNSKIAKKACLRQEELLLLKSNLKELREFTEVCSVAVPLLQEMKNLQVLYQKCSQAEKTAQDLSLLLEKAKKMEYMILNNFINTINITVSDILNQVFDDPISLNFVLFKGDRPVVECIANYKGSEDSLSGLSGGEKNRVSVAITVALSLLSPFPFMAVDESFKSLDDDTREKCLEAIRRLVNNKAVFIVSHEDVEGFYDHTFKF